MRNALFFVLLLSVAETSCAQIQAAIVRIKAYKDEPKTIFEVGSGSIVKYHDRLVIATCYHVIANSYSIAASSDDENLSDISLIAVDSKRDLALLGFKRTYTIKNYLGLEDVNTGFRNRPCRVWGFPLDWQMQSVLVDISHEGFVNNTTLIGQNGEGIFQNGAQFDVINFAVSASYGGWSGGPLVADNKVIGIFSGSMNEGGTLGWAIPVKYIIMLDTLPYPIREFKNLPLYRGLNPKYHFLVRSLRVVQQDIDSASRDAYQKIKIAFTLADTSYGNMEEALSMSNEYYRKLLSSIENLRRLPADQYNYPDAEQKLTETAQLAVAVNAIKERGQFHVDTGIINGAVRVIFRRISSLSPASFDSYSNQMRGYGDKIRVYVAKIFASDDSLGSMLNKGHELLNSFLKSGHEWEKDSSYATFKTYMGDYYNYNQLFYEYTQKLIAHSLLLIDYIATLNNCLGFLFEADLYSSSQNEPI